MKNKIIEMTIIVILVIFAFTISSSATSTTPPAAISNLHVDQYGQDYINWSWKDPNNTDFDHVDVYINGVYKVDVKKGVRLYNATGLSPSKSYKISTHTVDTYGNIDPDWKNNTQKTANATDSNITNNLNTTNIPIKFITIGDPHMSGSTSDAYLRLTKAVNYVNSMSGINFVVVVGDVSGFGNAKIILDKLHVPYYAVPGNHDLKSGSLTDFTKYFGPAERILNISGYQVILVGIKGTSDNYEWSFDYSRADKNKPTLIFDHGPVQPKPGGTCSDWGSYFGYACDMKKYTDQFTNLIGYYSGHTHVGTAQIIGNTLYTTEDNLGGYGPDSDYIGLTDLYDGKAHYSLIRYN